MSTLPETVKIAEFAKLFGLTPRRIRQLISEDTLPSEGRDRMPLVQAACAFVEWKATSAVRARMGDGSELDAERTRKLRLENDETERTLMRTDDALAALDAIVGVVAAELAVLPARMSDDIKARRRAENEIDKMLNALERRLLRAGADVEAGRDALGSDAESAADDLGGDE